MKRTIAFLLMILFIGAGCGQRQSGNDDLVLVDITKTPSSKKELILQDFMDVEYIALETNDEFVNQGFVQAIGEKNILVRNYKDDGDIFVYDRTGKALRKINRKGQGGEEYTGVFNMILDEDNDEMFVSDIYAKKIVVYDMYGTFKRSFKHKEGTGSQFYIDMFNYDKDHLICYDEYNEEIPFLIISKQDGKVVKEVEVPYKEKIFLQQQMRDEASDITYTVGPGPHRSIIPFKGDWLLSELSSDTVYSLLSDYSLRPFLARTPPIGSMDPKEFLLMRLFSDRYYFMETIKNVYDFDSKSGFPRTFLMYDKLEDSFFKYTVYNGDYTIKEEIYMNSFRPVNHEIESWRSLESYRLILSYEKDQLKGKLKEIAATLDEDSNPVIMLVKHR
ncbi:6-bladed beta-propeller [Massilibacteroides vaginae]|uniref:6-bladed beta-propeller n=1 Tax=Massilibacteroides vaginae TaxID=1673718 RepID=UPI000A1CBCDF|nr:6-bladed beta-propeller [Massilibacteroides vaginae]